MMNKLKTIIMSVIAKRPKAGRQARNDRYIRIALAAIMLINVLAGTPAFALFDDLGMGARAPGMGNAAVGLADDVNAIHYNPAGLTQLEVGEFTTMYGQFLTGLDDGTNISTTYLGYGTPLKGGQWGALGFGFYNFKVSKLLNERTLYLSYGWKTKLKPLGIDGELSMGTSLKQLHHEFESDRFIQNSLNDAGTASNQSDPLLSGGLSNDAYALDIGSLYRFGRNQHYSAGFMVRNINRPDVSLGGTGEKAPLSIKFGLAYRPRWGALTAEIRRISQLSSQADTEAAVGAERRIGMGELGAVTLRGGYAEGSRDFKAVNAGMSYDFHRAQLDYAFNFPVGNQDDSEGTHRIGFSFKVGAVNDAIDRMNQEMKFDLLSSFENDARTSYVLLQRSKKTLGLNAEGRFTLLQYLLTKYSHDKDGTKDIRSDLTAFLSSKRYGVVDWPTLKASIVKSLDEQDKLNVEHALEKIKEEDTAFGLARMGLLSDSGRKDTLIKTIIATSHGELAARAYRAHDIDLTINHVRQILEVMPNDEVVTVAYRQLLLMRTQNIKPEVKPMATPAPVTESVSPKTILKYEDLPEAPQALVAPTPVVKSDSKKLPEFDSDVRAFGTLLGYYFTRKTDGATPEEKLILLQQMKTLYGDKGIDMTLVDKEILLVAKELDVTAKPKQPEVIKEPEVKKEIVPAPTPAVKKVLAPKPAVPKKPIVERRKDADRKDPEVERYWLFYLEAVNRGITDYERIEMLEKILIRFGEATAEEVNRELERLRTRAY